MRIVIAPDTFKGSLGSTDVAFIMSKAILDIDKDVSVINKPMADGGEGTLKVLSDMAENGRYVGLTVNGPTGNYVKTSYLLKERDVAVIESAEIVGLNRVPRKLQHPDHTTSYGIGETIKDALDKGCTRLLIGLGGSATNDGGLGMLLALGMSAFDESGRELNGFGKDMLRVSHISLQQLDPRLKKVTIKVASDVDNPLCGMEGASHVYGKQKGLTSEQREHYDRQMALYARIIEKTLKQTYQHGPGAGAAGGLGFALLALGGQIVSGAKLIAKEIKLDEAIKQADVVITGEGKSDNQTLSGKAPGYVGFLAKEYGGDTLLISGSLGDNIDPLTTHFTYCFSLMAPGITLRESMQSVRRLLYERTREAFQYYRQKMNS